MTQAQFSRPLREKSGYPAAQTLRQALAVAFLAVRQPGDGSSFFEDRQKDPD
jgi:hypothetical protein